MNLLFEEVYHSKIQIKYALDNWTAAQKSAAALVDGDGNTIIDYDMLSGTVADFFSSFYSMLEHSTETITLADAALMIFNRWNRFKLRRGDNIIRAFEALNTVYDPLFNYDKHSEEAQDVNALVHGKKISVNTDLKEGTNTDIKTATSRDMKHEHAVNSKVSTASDLKSAINTDISEAETQTTKSDKRPTWAADDQTTAQEVVVPGTKTTSGTAANNYTQTTGTAAGNYTQTEGTAQNNYDREVGTAQLNYETKTGGAENNYKQKTGAALNNYSEESGTTTDTKTIGARHEYGNINGPSTQELLIAELNARRHDLIYDVVREWVSSIGYAMEVI